MKRAMAIVLSVLNMLLFLVSIVCTALTYRNNHIINSADRTFAYREENGEVYVNAASKAIGWIGL